MLVIMKGWIISFINIHICECECELRKKHIKNSK